MQVLTSERDQPIWIDRLRLHARLRVAGVEDALQALEIETHKLIDEQEHYVYKVKTLYESMQEQVPTRELTIEQVSGL
jgi:hypothetical protein